MAKFMKKPVVIEAFQWTVDEVPDWWRNASRDFLISIETGSIYIPTSDPTVEGLYEVMKGDYIIKGINGEFYPCKPDTFVATYDEVWV